MYQSDIKKGGVYTAKVSGKVVPLRIDSITTRPTYQSSGRDLGPGKIVNRTRYECTNLVTSRRITVKSAHRFRHRATKSIMDHLGLPLTLLPTDQQPILTPTHTASEAHERDHGTHPADDDPTTEPTMPKPRFPGYSTLPFQ